MAEVYIEGVYPKSVYETVAAFKGTESESSTPGTWLSQPRGMHDSTTEIVRYTFGSESSISAVSFDVNKIGLSFQLFYKDRSDEWLPLLQSNRHTISRDVMADEDHDSFAHFEYEAYPVIATALEFRLTRKQFPASPTTPSSIALKNVLIKRSVNTRQDASLPLPEYTDSLGNNVTNVVYDWDAANAFDSNSESFWKSEPQPHPEAVVSLYVDTRDGQGKPQWIDHFYLDPVTSGQQLNIYYSNDDTEGPNILSEAVIKPSSQENTTYVNGHGLKLSNQDSEITLNETLFDFEADRSHWIGFEWTPEFDSSSARTAYLYEHGDLMIYYDSNKLSIARGTAIRSLDMPEFTASSTTFSIAIGFNMNADSSRAGLYALVYDSENKEEYVLDDRSEQLSIPSEVTATLNDEQAQLEDLFDISNNRLTRKSPDGTIKLSIPASDTDGEKTLSIRSLSDVVFGGMLEDQLQFPEVKAGTTTIALPHTHIELCPNPLLDSSAAYLSQIHSEEPPAGNAVEISQHVQAFNMQPYIAGKRYDTFTCVLTAKHIYGVGQLYPALVDSAGELLETASVSNPTQIDVLDNGWVRQSFEIRLTADINESKLAFRVVPDQANPVDETPLALVSDISLTKKTNTAIPARQMLETTTASFEGSATAVELTLNETPGTTTFELPVLTTLVADPAYSPAGYIKIGDIGGTLHSFIIKQEELTANMARRFTNSPSRYTLPEPHEAKSISSPMSNALIVGRFRYEEAFRGGVDGTKFTDKLWTPIFTDWTVERGWYYLPQTTEMKYLKLEFTNLALEPYPIWEDSIKTQYQVFPVHVQETSRKLATLDTTTVTETTTTDTTTTTTSTDSRASSSKQNHSRSVDSTSGSSSEYSEVDLPREYSIEVQKPVTTQFPVETGIQRESDFHVETANSTIFKGTEVSTNTSFDTQTWMTQRTVTDTVNRTWTETKLVPRKKWVAQDVYYRVQKGDTLIGIAKKLGIPDWKVIYAYNIWLQSDRRVRMLPKRYPGWWIFPGQNFRIPNAVMKQITVYEKVSVKRSSTQTVKRQLDVKNVQETTTTATTVTDTQTDRLETLSTFKDRFRSTSVHRYDIKEVERKDSVAYFASIREIKIAKTNWQTMRDTPVFDFSDFEADGFTLNKVKKLDGSVFVPDGSGQAAQIRSPIYKTISNYRTVKIIGVNKNSVFQSRNLPFDSIKANSGSTVIDNRLFINTSNPVITAGPVSAKKGTNMAGSMVAFPHNPVSSNASIRLSVIDNSTGSTLSSRIIPESSLIAGRDNVLKFDNTFLSKDYDSILFKVEFIDKGSTEYSFSSAKTGEGSVRFLVRNNSQAEFEDVSSAVGKLDSIYTFKDAGNELEILIEMNDINDWTSGIKVIPLYLTSERLS